MNKTFLLNYKNNRVVILDESSDTFKLTFFSEPVYKATVESYNTIPNNPFERYSISDLSKNMLFQNHVPTSKSYTKI